MAEVLSYYIADYNGDKVTHITDTGVALADSGTSSSAINAPSSLAFDDDNNIYVASSASSRIALSLLNRDTLAFIPIAGDNVHQSSSVNNESQGMVYYNGKVYIVHQNNSNTASLLVFDTSSETWSDHIVTTTTDSCYGITLSSDNLYLYIGVTDGLTTPRVARWNIATQTTDKTFGTLTSTFIPGRKSLQEFPDGSVVYSGGSATSSGVASYNPTADTVTFSQVTYSGDRFTSCFYVGGTTGVGCGKATGAIATFNYLTGVVTGDTYDLNSATVLSGAVNGWSEIVVVGLAGTDQDADGSWSIRVLSSDLSTVRKLNVGTQLNDILMYSVPGGLVSNPPVDSRTVRQLVAIGNDEVWYESTAGTMSELSDANGDIDTSILLTATEAYQKVFIANDSNLKVADFGGVKIQTDNIAATEANAPDKGNILTGAGGASFLVDYITSVSGASVLYGKKLNGTAFVDGEAVTGTNDAGNAVSFNIKAGTTEVAPPHWYDWTPYGGSATYGSMPNRATLVCTYRGRLVLSGNSEFPHQWYMSRQADPFDWLYFVNDAQSPVAGSDADAGKIGDIVTCLAPNKDDYMIIGCVSSIWVMRGDPAFGGSLDQISLTTGVFGATSYCWDAMDNFYFFGSNGICRIPSNLGGVENLSITVLPNIINDLSISPTTHRITLGYDRIREGIVIAITTLSTGANTNYYYDLRTSGFFPESYGFNPAPFSQFFYQANDEDYRKLLVGGSDGYIRYFDDDAKDDDAGDSGDVAIDSYAVIGPAQIGPDADMRGRMKTLSITTGTDTDGVDYDIYVADTAEEVVDNIESEATPHHTGTVSPGNRIQTLRPRSRGAWMGIKLQNDTASQTWQFEKTVADIKPAGDI